MKTIRRLFFLICIIFNSGQPMAQGTYTFQNEDSPYKIYKSLEQAMQYPDSVFSLDLSRKGIKTIPAEVYQLKNLVEFNVSRNKLKEIPVEIGQLRNLKIFKASNNKIVSIPAEIGNLTQLQVLELNRNLIVSLPPEVGKLSLLEKIELWDNEIDSLPDALSQLKNLKVLELRGILFTEEAQIRIKKLVPNTSVYFSPSCLCKD